MSSKFTRALAIQYGDQRMEFEVVPSSAHVSSVRISVDPLAGIQVFAPKDASDSEIRNAVRKRAKWIYRNIGSQQESATRKRFIGGEEVLYLGRRYALKHEESQENSVKLRGGRLIVRASRHCPDDISAAVDHWYRERAEDYFCRRIHALFSPGLDARNSPPEFRLRMMRRQWGSCSPSGSILLNPLLIRAPKTCVDYVITHELCHLKHHDHGPGFYRLLNARMPDWQERKAFLELVAAQILAR